jgi:outer membrane protein TolC
MKPDLAISGGISRGDTDASQSDSLAIGESAWMVGVTFETSLSRNKEKADMQISELSVEKARNDLKDLQDAISLECSSVARSLENMRAQVFATDRARKLQAKRLQLEQKKFDQGRSDVRWVIEAQDARIAMRLLHYRALAAYRQAQAGYRVVQGLAPTGGTK